MLRERYGSAQVEINLIGRERLEVVEMGKCPDGRRMSLGVESP